MRWKVQQLNFSHVKHVIKIIFLCKYDLKRLERHQESETEPDDGFREFKFHNSIPNQKTFYQGFVDGNSGGDISAERSEPWRQSKITKKKIDFFDENLFHKNELFRMKNINIMGKW